ncbi:MAG: chemotaxis protein CheA [Spirochaetales bacterium]|nr:chemotaxis protein CheA [Spirochaetales bacterium]
MDLEYARQIFFAEATDLLEEMESCLVKLEKNPESPETLAALFRTAHTLKGSAGIFDFSAIVEFMHGLEQVLSLIRDGERSFAATGSAIFFRCLDHSRSLMEAARTGSPADDARTVQLLRELDVMAQMPEAEASTVDEKPGAASGANPAPADYHFSFLPPRQVFQLGLDPLAPLRQINRHGTILDLTTLTGELQASLAAGEFRPEECFLAWEGKVRLVNKNEILDFFEFFPDAEVVLEKENPQKKADDSASDEKNKDEAAAKATSPPISPAAPDNAPRFIRVDTDRLDGLVNLVGELVIAGAGMAELVARQGDIALLEASRSMSRMISDLRDRSLGIRMVPLVDAFARYRRAVREIAQEIGKEAELLIQTGDTELDKNVVEQLADPLLHLIRNAVDHGIESREERIQSGKPPVGQIVILAYQETGSVVVEIRDDGRGFQLERILTIAREKNLISGHFTPAEAEILKLPFLPGFSTASTVSRLSGRGVGLDVVKESIQNLRGQVELQNSPTGGSLIRIRLPLTLAIIEGFLIRVGQENYVIPMDLVHECIDHDSPDLLKRMNSLKLRDEVLPQLVLSEFFQSPASGSSRQNVVIVGYAGKKAAFVVDELLGEFQAVIKPLSRIFSRLPGVNGATILGTGKVALILDVPGLLSFAAERESAA